MIKSLDGLFNKRADAESEVDTTTAKLVSELENYVLTIIYIGSKTSHLGEVNFPQIVEGVKKIYDDRFEERDITTAIRNLKTEGYLLESQKRDRPSSYCVGGDVEKNHIKINPVPLVEKTR